MAVLLGGSTLTLMRMSGHMEAYKSAAASKSLWALIFVLKWSRDIWKIYNQNGDGNVYKIPYLF